MSPSKIENTNLRYQTHLTWRSSAILCVHFTLRQPFRAKVARQSAQFHVCQRRRRIMAGYNQAFSQQQGAIHSAMPRLYKFALVLTANGELARGLMRGTLRALNIRNERQEDDASRITAGFRRMYALWSAKLDEDSSVHKKCPPDPRIFAAAFAKGPHAGNAQFARFIANLPSAQRCVLYLVYGEGASYDEAADIAALNMAALMTLLARGHAALSQSPGQRGLSDADPHLQQRERAA
jgi:RNA polymerase sigma-70 factor, ECF subfamily